MNSALLILAFVAVAAISCVGGFFLGARGAARYYARQLASINRKLSVMPHNWRAENPQSQQGA